MKRDFWEIRAIRFPSAVRLGNCLTFSVSKFGAAEETASFRVIKDVRMDAVRNSCHH